MTLSQEKVFVKENHIVINVVNEYNIAISRCDTADKLLNWIYHLTEKTWMTTDVMRQFIEIACRESNINMGHV